MYTQSPCLAATSIAALRLRGNALDSLLAGVGRKTIPLNTMASVWIATFVNPGFVWERSVDTLDALSAVTTRIRRLSSIALDTELLLSVSATWIITASIVGVLARGAGIHTCRASWPWETGLEALRVGWNPARIRVVVTTIIYKFTIFVRKIEIFSAAKLEREGRSCNEQEAENTAGKHLAIWGLVRI